MVGVDEAFKSKMKMLGELFKSKLFNLITAANMHSQNTGGRKEHRQQIFGVLQLETQVVPLINFIFNCNFRLLINITTGQTSYEYPYFGYADRCTPDYRTQYFEADLNQQ